MHITYTIHSRFNQCVCRPEWTRPDRLDQTDWTRVTAKQRNGNLVAYAIWKSLWSDE